MVRRQPKAQQQEARTDCGKLMQRTSQQNRAMHKWFTLLSEALNDQGYDMREVKVDIPASPELVKEVIFKPVMQAYFPGVESTTELTTKQMTQVYEVLNRAFGEKMGIHVPWPSEDENA